jgi:hypothetical protein
MDIMSIIGSSYGVVKDCYQYVKKRVYPFTPSEKLEKRKERKAEFEKYLSSYRKTASGSSEMIIRDIARIDNYPQIEKGRSIAPWFKVEVQDIYLNRGIEVLVWVEKIRYIKDKGYVWAHYKEENAITVYLIGRILFESIESVDWDGDENYNIPHLYCRFSKKNGPYTELIYSEKMELNSRSYFKEVAKFEEVKRQSRKMKIKRF